MRHGVAGNRLNRNQTLRKATVRDLAKATLIKQRICTTIAKAKEARKLVEKLITMGKGGTLANKRRAFSILCDHGVVSDLFNNISPRFNSRMGGYTRIIQLGNRRGDNARMVYLELTEKVEIKPVEVVTADKSLKVKDVDAEVKDDASVESKEAAAKKAFDKEKLKKAGSEGKKTAGGLKQIFTRGAQRGN